MADKHNPFPALFMLLGSFVLVVGIWMIYPPASLIAAGALIAAFGFYGRRGAL
jgi:hypothetical protein